MKEDWFEKGFNLGLEHYKSKFMLEVKLKEELTEENVKTIKDLLAEINKQIETVQQYTLDYKNK